MSTQGKKVVWRKYYDSFKLTIFKRAHFIYKKFIEPKSENEESKRHEFIFNTILLPSIFLLIIASFVIFVCEIIYKPYHGLPIEINLAVLLFFIVLYFLSRSGFLLIQFLFL